MENSIEDQYKVKLVSFGERKMMTLLAVKEITGLNTPEANDILESLGTIQEGISRHAADEVKQKLESVGATVAVEHIGEPEQEVESSDTFVVYGRVMQANEDPISGVLVRAFDRDLRSEQLLGESATNSEGEYQITYTGKQFLRAEKFRADLVLRVYNEVGIPLKVENAKIIFNAQHEEHFNLFLAEQEPVKPSEYERLIALLQPVLNGVSPADLTDEEITFLSHETQIEEFEREFPYGNHSIPLLAQSARLSQETGVPTEAFYGWGRFDNTAWVTFNEESFTLDLEPLIAESDERLIELLESAIAENWKPARLKEQSNEIVTRLRATDEEQATTQVSVEGKLLNEEDEQPLSNYIVRAETVEENTQSLGSDVTDRQGNFAFTYPLPVNEDTAELRLRLQIIQPQGDALSPQEVQVSLPQESPIRVIIPKPEPVKPTLPGSEIKLENLNGALGESIPEALLEKLQSESINTLADIRTAGGLSRIQNLPVSNDSPLVKSLEAQANLSILSGDLEQNRKLINAGFDSPLEMANHSLESYLIKTRRAEIDSASAIALHFQSQALYQGWNNRIIELEKANNNDELGQVLSDALEAAEAERVTERLKESLAKRKCQCECLHALSPAAYLVELLDYLTKHLLLSNNDSVDLEFLTKTFHQPFDRLPLSCESMKKRVSQVRISVEVLNGYLVQNPPSDLAPINAAKKTYLFSAYQELLRQIGASYEEIRLARVDKDLRQRLSGRLLISLDKLNNGVLFLDADDVTEDTLLAVFGYAGIVYDPDTADDQTPQLLQWQQEELRQQWLQADWHQDEAGQLKAGVPLIDPDIVAFSDAKTGAAARRLLGLRRRDTESKAQAAANQSRTLGGLNTLLADYANTTTDEIKATLEADSSAEDIEAYLTEHGLTRAALRYLEAIIQLLENSQSVTRAEWQEVGAIVTQAWKKRLFADWRSEEHQAGISLSPDFFQLGDYDIAERLNSEPSLEWRIDLTRHQDWRQLLETRIQQEARLKESLQTAIRSTESTTLPSLRDAMIVASEAEGEQLEEKAEWLTQQLLIDMRVDGCHQTTRVAQAIESLQNLVFSIRTGQLDDNVARFKPLPDSFEDDWRWVGSYSTWKSATSIYLYPENVLIPSIHTQQTPVFEDIIKTIQNTQNFSSSSALVVASKYSSYFEDIATIEVETSCYANGLIYLFGKGRASGTIYWSTYKYSDDEGSIELQFWSPILNSEEYEIEGSVVHGLSRSYVVLFARDKSIQKELQFIRFDLINFQWKSWDSLPIEIDDEGNISIAVVQQHSGEAELIFASTDTNLLYRKTLNEQATNWSYDEWEPISLYDKQNQQYEPSSPYYKVLAAFGANVVLHIGSGIKIVHITYDSTFLVYKGKVSEQSIPTSSFRLEGEIIGSGKYIGAAKDGKNVYVYIVRRTPQGPQMVYYYPIDNSGQIQAEELGVDVKDSNIKHIPTFDANLPRFPYNKLDGTSNIGSFKSGKIIKIIQLNLLPVSDFDISDNKIGGGQSFVRSFEYLILKSDLSVPSSSLRYLDEAYFYVPLVIAQSLQKESHYSQALAWYQILYDYGKKKMRFPFNFLANSSSSSSNLNHNDWYSNPIDPHTIASTREDSYLRYTIISLVSCLLDYADAEFTQDNAESLPRARTLYTTALELLSQEMFQKKKLSCDQLIVKLLNEIDEPELRATYRPILKPLTRLKDQEQVDIKLSQIQEIIHNGHDQTLEELEEQTTSIVQEAVSEENSFSLLNPAAMAALQNNYEYSLTNFLLEYPSLTTLTYEIDTAYLEEQIRQQLGGLTLNGSEEPLPIPPHLRPGYVPKVNFQFCIPENPLVDALKQRATLNLYKLRTCRNIAGVARSLEVYSTSSDTTSGLASTSNGQLNLSGTQSLQPTQYRYSFIIDRAKELISITQQMESAYLSAFQNLEEAQYSELRAEQDLQLARTGVKLQDLRVQQAQGEVTLAVLQKHLSVIQKDNYSNLLAEGLLWQEKTSTGFMVGSASLYTAASIVNTVGGGQEVWKSILTLGIAGDAAGSAAQSLSYLASATSTTASIFSTLASYERRRQEWEFQKRLAKQNLRIGNQQIRLAEDAVRIVSQERNISNLQVQHAETTAEFLLTKNLNADLYAWMVGILRGVYSYFLQQATGVAKLAEAQLAFERQEGIASYIQANYWNTNNNTSSSSSSESEDRFGLTGSARLLQDIYKLDQYAFETNRRKLQLTKTISLSQYDPFAFQQFRETGILRFDTPLEIFDRDFPGHYLRLIKQIRTSIIALVPPTEGIKATLRSSGNSRVVISKPLFQPVSRNLEPQSVALTSPINATGLFELQQSPEVLLPFEGMGVDTDWSLELPKASNPFDFTTIADVLFTIEYTALHSEDYKQQVIRQIDRSVSGDRAFSFRQELSDAWYDLHNPDLTDKPMQVAFEVRRRDFPANIDGLQIKNVMLYFASANGELPEIDVTLELFQEGSPIQWETTVRDGVASSRRTSTGGIRLTEKSPEGNWTLILPNTDEIKQLFKQEKIEDVLFVITYEGQTPAWPA